MDGKVEALTRLHEGPEPLVLVNVWDAVSARVVAAQPGCRAIATASWSIAAAHGVPDGEALARDAMLAAVERVAAAVTLPVTADLEQGYGETAADVAETMRRARAAGVAGCNIEDGAGDADGDLRRMADAVERVAAAVDAGLAVNARTDAFLLGVDGALEEAVARGRAFVDAGAVCVFVPGVADAATIATLVREIGPVSVLATPASPSISELAAIGVRRISFGPGPLGVASAALASTAAELLAGGPYPAELANRP